MSDFTLLGSGTMLSERPLTVTVFRQSVSNHCYFTARVFLFLFSISVAYAKTTFLAKNVL